MKYYKNTGFRMINRDPSEYRGFWHPKKGGGQCFVFSVAPFTEKSPGKVSIQAIFIVFIDLTP